MRLVATLLLAAAVALPAAAQPVAVQAADTVQSVLASRKDKRVTLRLRSGQELTGVVRDATPKLVVLGAVAGRELFDAVVPLESVEAVLVRTKE